MVPEKTIEHRATDITWRRYKLQIRGNDRRRLERSIPVAPVMKIWVLADMDETWDVVVIWLNGWWGVWTAVDIAPLYTSLSAVLLTPMAK